MNLSSEGDFLYVLKIEKDVLIKGDFGSYCMRKFEKCLSSIFIIEVIKTSKFAYLGRIRNKNAW